MDPHTIDLSRRRILLRKIKVYNTLTRDKHELVPLEPGHIRLYACGVTVYDDCHIGHAMQAIFFDIMRNYLEYTGYKVTYVRNYTDVDDKIINRAKQLNISPKELSERMIRSCEDDLDQLEVKPASFQPKVSENIPEIIDMIEQLIKNDFAYSTSQGNVYFRVRNCKDYGKLSNRKVDELRGGTRSLKQDEKEDELDFALWKKEDTADACWPSPWGMGRPGWHIECSAMAKKYLGDSFDIHGGGIDLVFPHHENEIAQSESSNCCSYATTWIHSGLMTIEKQKMSKSLGNFITIKDFLSKWPNEVLRLGFLQNHYSSNIDFSQQTFKNCKKRLLYYYETLKHLNDYAQQNTATSAPVDARTTALREDFHKHMSDNFNTPAAIACINEVMKKANQLIKKKRTEAHVEFASALSSLLKEWGLVLGLLQKDPASFIQDLKFQLLADLGIEIDHIETLIKERWEAKQAKNWTKSDDIRNQLLSQGIILQDRPEGCDWSICVDEESIN